MAASSRRSAPAARPARRGPTAPARGERAPWLAHTEPFTEAVDHREKRAQRLVRLARARTGPRATRRRQWSRWSCGAKCTTGLPSHEPRRDPLRCADESVSLRVHRPARIEAAPRPGGRSVTPSDRSGSSECPRHRRLGRQVSNCPRPCHPRGGGRWSGCRGPAPAPAPTLVVQQATPRAVAATLAPPTPAPPSLIVVHLSGEVIVPGALPVTSWGSHRRRGPSRRRRDAPRRRQPTESRRSARRWPARDRAAQGRGGRGKPCWNRRRHGEADHEPGATLTRRRWLSLTACRGSVR